MLIQLKIRRRKRIYSLDPQSQATTLNTTNVPSIEFLLTCLQLGGVFFIVKLNMTPTQICIP